MVRSDSRDSRAPDYGTYWLVGGDGAFYVPTGAWHGTMRPVGFTLDEVEAYLLADPEGR